MKDRDYAFHDYESLQAQRKEDRDLASFAKSLNMEKRTDRAHPYSFPRIQVIGIGGLFGAGKDEVADQLVREHDFVKLGMSDALAEALYALNPIVGVDSVGLNLRYQTLVTRVGYTQAKKNPEVRRLLQVLGTEVGRNIISDTVWVDIMKRRVRENVQAGHHVIVTGMRFPNELEAIRELHGTLWWVDRPSDQSENVGGNSTSATVKAHASEQSVFEHDFDSTILNDGTLEDLAETVNGHWGQLTNASPFVIHEGTHD